MRGGGVGCGCDHDAAPDAAALTVLSIAQSTLVSIGWTNERTNWMLLASGCVCSARKDPCEPARGSLRRGSLGCSVARSERMPRANSPMSGMRPRPTIVGSHLPSGVCVLLPTSRCVAHTARLITTPGTMTDAKACQHKVSANAIPAALHRVLPPSTPSGSSLTKMTPLEDVEGEEESPERWLF